MALLRGVKRSALIAIAVPAFVVLTAISTLAETTPSPTSGAGTGASGARNVGDPTAGGTLFSQVGCATCHGAALTGGIGPALNPIVKFPSVPNPLDPTYLFDTIKNGRTPQPGDGYTTLMPARGGDPALTDQNIRDLAAFIIQQNQNPGGAPLAAGDLAKLTILWVVIGIGAMSVITYLLAQYNMRWIARRAAARNK
jgi:mono/diheme cytochrome c family protein